MWGPVSPMSDSRVLRRLEAFALVAIGGFAGANLRYFADLLVGGLPATLLVNVLGSFALGFVLYEALYVGAVSTETRSVVATGFLSSFTTYSTFALQSAQSPLPVLVGNVVGSYALGFAGVLVGRALARRVGGGEH